MNLNYEETKKVVVLASGGMDSSTTMLKLANDGFAVYPLMVIYKKEIADMEEKAAKSVISWLKSKGLRVQQLKTVDFELMQALRKETRDYAEHTFFPFRNLIFATIGALYGYTRGIRNISLGLCKPAYPDCTPVFQEKLKAVLTESVSDEIDVLAPFINQSKFELVEYGVAHGFPYEKTYSCYEGGKNHCGRCDGCEERKISFHRANIKDPTLAYDFEK